MSKKAPKTLGEKIQKLREAKELTQVELADVVNVSPSYIGAIEQGKRQPSLKTLKKIARKLGSKASDLIPF